MNPNLTREEFDYLLQQYADAYGEVVFSHSGTREERDRALDKAVAAKRALEQAVFPEDK